MVRRTNYSKRFAFTMIELIFAIVVIAISVVSLPMMTQATQRGIESNILQEAIFAASAELMGATAGYWDERSMEDEDFSNDSRVINIHSGTEPACNADRLRPGHILQPLHRRCLESDLSSNLNLTDTSIFSLDDAENTTSTDIFVDDTATGTADETGYKELYTSTTVVSQSSTNANVKVITVTVSNSDGIVTVLRTQSANIGEIDYYKRTF